MALDGSQIQDRRRITGPLRSLVNETPQLGPSHHSTEALAFCVSSTPLGFFFWQTQNIGFFVLVAFSAHGK